MVTSSARSPEPIRRIVHFSGRVQGVGFRYTTQRVAAGLGVTGYVRNLPDGRVELVAEGVEEELDRFQHAIDEAMPGHITETTVTQSPPTGEFASFRIMP